MLFFWREEEDIFGVDRNYYYSFEKVIIFGERFFFESSDKKKEK